MSYTVLIDPTTGKKNPGLIARDSDGAVIPADPMNADWAAYQAWLEAGNKPSEPQAPAPQPSHKASRPGQQ
ncbi:protein of unknown function [Beijerinckiaceae bacterium RH AL1]|nr:hypothetical protein [Beijerinckiaceae bacterium]VVB44043.1 protein of unknown function [Beijerinckiaceae bacterium RH CH11]VVB44070.1 protein of unknown function [Beijerinckiaceae bacterium RH AL8]VVC54142.1 protein of unknown function [Beijerinckiaceae bacterium RH AL1]